MSYVLFDIVCMGMGSHTFMIHSVEATMEAACQPVSLLCIVHLVISFSL
jgi:hypothetical protein